MLALEFFHSLSQKDTLSIHETLIMAYGQAARYERLDNALQRLANIRLRVCGEDELPIILLQLVEYLGHTNALICGMAYNEVYDHFNAMLYVANVRSLPPSRNFRIKSR